MSVLTIRERDRLSIGEPGAELSEAHASALSRLSRALPMQVFSWEHKAIRFGPYCGVLRVGDLTIEILPKVPTSSSGDRDARGILIAMLRAAGEIAATSIGEAPLGLQRFHLLDVFIIDFCERVNDLLRSGAIRTYETRDENLAAVRGRIHLAEHIRRNLVDRSRLFCRYDEFSVDNAHNQALKAMLTRLLNHASSFEAKGAVNGLLRRMEDVSIRLCSIEQLARLRFDRLTRLWRPIFERAAWFLKGFYPDVRAGSVDNVCLLFDMERLFEAFVGVLLLRSWRDSGARVLLQGPRRYLASATAGPAFEMRPDVTVTTEDRRPQRVYDAKWKGLNIAGQNSGVSRDDIYQMASYASGYGCDHITLLYPSSDVALPGLVETFELSDAQSSCVDVFALDLHALVRGAPLPRGVGPEA